NRYEEDFARCRELGLTAFRLGLEWSRIQPSRDAKPGPPPPFDDAALDHYAAMIAACQQHGLEPVVTLHHFVHPAWLGSDPWLDETTAIHFAEYGCIAVGYMNERLLWQFRWFIFINKPNMMTLKSYQSKRSPQYHFHHIHPQT